MKTALKKLARTPIKQPRRSQQKIESSPAEVHLKKAPPPVPKSQNTISSKKTARQKTSDTAKVPETLNEENLSPVKPRPKTLKPLGKAVFRGKKALYDFKVFSLDEQFEAVQAVYIISKRKTDKNRRAHHLLLCIGQTDSVVEAIKKHRKNRCLKKNNANVISLLREPDAKKRLQIADDLKAAHTIVCNLEELKIEN